MRAVFLAFTLALAACGQATTTPDTSASQPAPGAAAELGHATTLPHTLPPTSTAPRFVGLWAASDDGCVNPPWTIRADGLSTMGEVSCRFDRVSEAPGGYDVDATCSAEGAERTHRLQMRFAESAQALLIDGGPWDRQVGLIHCGPLPGR